MKCVQQLTLVIKVPTGDHVQRKTNDQNEQKWLEEDKDNEVQLGDKSDPTVRLSGLCVPPFLSSNSQGTARKNSKTQTWVCVQKSSLDFSRSKPLYFNSVLSWILQFKTKHSLEWLLKQYQKPGSSFRNHWAQCSLKRTWEELGLAPVDDPLSMSPADSTRPNTRSQEGAVQSPHSAQQ